MNATILAGEADKAARDRIIKYIALLGKWRRVTNLISDSSFDEIWTRHIFDAIQLHRQMPKAKRWLDIGSGAGLPSVIIASILADDSDAQVHCVEIDRRKCAFLREVASQLLIPLKVHNTFAEDIDLSRLPNIEVVTAQAFSSVQHILKLAEPFMSRRAVVIMPRGPSAYDEVAQIVNKGYIIHVRPNAPPGGGAFVRVELRDSHC